jgi:L-glyceraldehyde 3-phosphate reductase
MAKEKFLKSSALTPRMHAALTALNEVAARRGQSLAEMALAWCLKDDRVTSVIVGASRVSQLEDDFKALENTSFTPEELAEIDAIVLGAKA